MHPKELKSSLISKALFSLFIHFVDELEKTDKYIKKDENRKCHIKDGVNHILNASIVEEKI